MKNKNNIRILPNKERDNIQAAMDTVARIMPKQAELAILMRKEFTKVGFTEDEALQLVAYSIFK